MIKTFSEANDNEQCYIPSEIPLNIIKSASTFLNDFCRTVIISKYNTIEEILSSLSFSNFQIITKKSNFRTNDYMTLANIYEHGWNYHIVHPITEIINQNVYKPSDIIVLLKINKFRKTLNLILVNRNDNTLKTFDRAIFNLYATIGISIKNLSRYEFDFCISNELFDNLKKDYKVTNNKLIKYKQKISKDYVYYDKYKLTNDIVSSIIIGERYDKQYWIESLEDISKLIKKYVLEASKSNQNSASKDLKDEYAVLEITNENPYYYHYFMVNSPDKVYLIDSINICRNDKINVLELFSKIYKYKDFELISDDFDIYRKVLYSEISLVNSLTSLAAALISTGKIYIYNTCPSIIKIKKWILYDLTSEFSICCVGLDRKFISHYIDIGFTKIIFFNNSIKVQPLEASNSALKDSTLKETEQKYLIEIPVDLFMSNMYKFQLYNQAASYYCKINDKLLIIDDDEFLDVNSVNNIECFDNTLSFYWKLYNSGGYIYHTDDYSKYEYVKLSDEYKTMTIINKDTVYNSNHQPNNCSNTKSIYKIKHYITKSLEDYILKCKIRTDTLGSLRYHKQAYQLFIKINPMFSGTLSKADFKKLMESDNLKDELVKMFGNKNRIL